MIKSVIPAAPKRIGTFGCDSDKDLCTFIAVCYHYLLELSTSIYIDDLSFESEWSDRCGRVGAFSLLQFVDPMVRRH